MHRAHWDLPLKREMLTAAAASVRSPLPSFCPASPGDLHITVSPSATTAQPAGTARTHVGVRCVCVCVCKAGAAAGRELSWRDGLSPCLPSDKRKTSHANKTIKTRQYVRRKGYTGTSQQFERLFNLQIAIHDKTFTVPFLPLNPGLQVPFQSQVGPPYFS